MASISLALKRHQRLLIRRLFMLSRVDSGPSVTAEYGLPHQDSVLSGDGNGLCRCGIESMLFMTGYRCCSGLE